MRLLFVIRDPVLRAEYGYCLSHIANARTRNGTRCMVPLFRGRFPARVPRHHRASTTPALGPLCPIFWGRAGTRGSRSDRRVDRPRFATFHLDAVDARNFFAATGIANASLRPVRTAERRVRRITPCVLTDSGRRASWGVRRRSDSDGTARRRTDGGDCGTIIGIPPGKRELNVQIPPRSEAPRSSQCRWTRPVRAISWALTCVAAHPPRRRRRARALNRAINYASPAARVANRVATLRERGLRPRVAESLLGHALCGPSSLRSRWAHGRGPLRAS